jgi:hypothetical protein
MQGNIKSKRRQALLLVGSGRLWIKMLSSSFKKHQVSAISLSKYDLSIQI